MAAESNSSGLYSGQTFSSALNRHAISFQSGGIDSNSSEMIPMGGSASNFYGIDTSSSLMLAANNSTTVTSSLSLPPPPPPCASSLLLDSPSGINHDTGLAADWSVDEQIILEEGLSKYANEPNIMRYIKIAATLRDKTVRDVALRCRWMTRKRRKADEYNLGKMANSRKDKLVESSSMMSVPSAVPQNMSVYPLMIYQADQGEPLSFEGISSTSMYLLEQNVQAFSKIAANLSTLKLQDNIDLFYRTRANLTAILNDMRGMPGIMSQMPPLPVSINEDLANCILPSTNQSMMLCPPSRIQLKQEPKC